MRLSLLDGVAHGACRAARLFSVPDGKEHIAPVHHAAVAGMKAVAAEEGEKGLAPVGAREDIVVARTFGGG